MPPSNTIHSFEPQKIRLDGTCQHYLDGFCCGNEEIDRYVKEDALLAQTAGKGATTLIVTPDHKCLIAYYTLAATGIYTEKSAVLLSAVEIKMFAVNECFQDTLILPEKKLVSESILNSLLGDFYEISSQAMGFEYAVLHSVPDACDFYRRVGFDDMGQYIHPETDFEKGCIPMYQKLYPDDMGPV